MVIFKGSKNKVSFADREEIIPDILFYYEIYCIFAVPKYGFNI
jgi:hypothetical protein